MSAPPAAGVHLHRLEIDLLSLQRHAQRRRHAADDDLGYPLHSLLAEAFGPLNLSSWFSRLHRRSAEVFGYASTDARALKAQADAFADPAVHQAIDWVGHASKPMPAEWPAGHRLGFEVRLCPVRRGVKGKGVRNPRREVDAFVAACARSPGEAVDREAVYRDWGRERLERGGAIEVESLQIGAWRRARLARADHQPQGAFRTVERPDVEFTGVLRVTDSTAFTGRLLQGFGRHGAFGFGMVRLRPAPC